MVLGKISEAKPHAAGARWSVRYTSGRLLKWNSDAGQVEMLTIMALDDATIVENANAQGLSLHPLSLSSTCVNMEGSQVGGLISSNWK